MRARFPILFALAASSLALEAPFHSTPRRVPVPLVDSLVTANARPLALRSGRLEGPGAAWLFGEAARAQFLVLGEEHNVAEIPDLTSAALRELQTRSGYHYVALEQDPITMEAASRPPLRGQLDSIAAFARRYPLAFTFVGDEELAMLADVGRVSQGAGDPLWGLDQAFGAASVLDRLLEITPRASPHVRATIARFRDSAAAHERVRDLATFHYLAAPKTESFAQLDSIVDPAAGSEAAFLLDNLVRSDRIYRSYRERQYYDNGYEREELMKQLFMREYRRAETADHALPRVILKMGHWHLYRGEGPSNLQTLGNFVSELARANGSGSFHVSIHSHNPAGGFRSLAAWPDSLADPLVAAPLPTDGWWIVDLRPLRANFGRIAAMLRGDQRESFRRLVFGFDAALYIGGMHPATYDLNPGVKY